MTIPETTKKFLVFLSHANEDKPAVRKLAKRLKKDGFDPWLDEERLIPGQNWELEIEKTLKASSAILLCCSKKSIAKEGFVQKEYKRAMYYQETKPEGEIFVIPVRLDKCELPFFLHELHWVDFPANYHHLLVALNTRANRLLPAFKTNSEINKIRSSGNLYQIIQGNKERVLKMKIGKFLLVLLVATIAGLMSNVVADYVAPTFENRHWLAILIFIICVGVGAIISLQDKSNENINAQMEQVNMQPKTNNNGKDVPSDKEQREPKTQKKKSKIDAELIKKFVQHDQLDKAVATLIEKGCDNALILDQRLSNLKRREILGTISRENVNAERTTIAHDIIEIIKSGEC